MNGKQKKSDAVEVSSEDLKQQLIEIKERIGALETIASISNRSVVETYVRTHLTSGKSKQIMKECAEPRTREELMSKFGFASAQALDHHLKPLRENDLLRPHFGEDGRQTFEWSNLFRRLPKGTLNKLLDEAE